MKNLIKRVDLLMEKYYCDHCRILYDAADVCTACGGNVSNKIWIEVQTQSNSNEITPDS